MRVHTSVRSARGSAQRGGGRYWPNLDRDRGSTRTAPTHRRLRVVRLLNGPWHGRAIGALLLLTAAHWTEHVLQAVQVYVLGWPRAAALGGLGLAFPELVTSEWLHFSDVLATLLILVLVRPAFHGRARRLWNAAIILETWHGIEHSLLLGQALTHTALFGATAPTSLVQLIVPRLELHLAYNAVVLVPMSWAVWVHCTAVAPASTGDDSASCGCRQAFARLIAAVVRQPRSAAARLGSR